jgi:hypothetical protein
MEADALTSVAGNNIWLVRQEQMGSIGVLEHGEHEIVSHGIPARPCILSLRSIFYTRSISSKVEEMVCKESDLLIVPMKSVTKVEGRGKHIIRSEVKTPVTQEVTRGW